MELLKTNIELRKVVKIVQILLHGDASVEAGVSINEDMLSACLKKLSLPIELSIMVL